MTMSALRGRFLPCEKQRQANEIWNATVSEEGRRCLSLRKGHLFGCYGQVPQWFTVEILPKCSEQTPDSTHYNGDYKGGVTRQACLFQKQRIGFCAMGRASAVFIAMLGSCSLEDGASLYDRRTAARSTWQPSNSASRQQARRSSR